MVRGSLSFIVLGFSSQAGIRYFTYWMVFLGQSLNRRLRSNVFSRDVQGMKSSFHLISLN